MSKPTLIGGYCIKFNRRTTGDQLFTRETDFGPLRKVAALLNHGMALGKPIERYSSRVLGSARLTHRQDGVFSWLHLDPDDELHRALIELVAEDCLGWSTGGFMTRIDDDGRVRRWVLYEVSLTPAPAAPWCRAVLL